MSRGHHQMTLRLGLSNMINLSMSSIAALFCLNFSNHSPWHHAQGFILVDGGKRQYL